MLWGSQSWLTARLLADFFGLPTVVVRRADAPGKAAAGTLPAPQPMQNARHREKRAIIELRHALPNRFLNEPGQ